ncbi:MAG: cytidylate kinase-like family protein [Desulfobacteraceae bacterium]|nr:cytidylate kinase-like family protein [Desulfobacteraceae bacterium]
MAIISISRGCYSHGRLIAEKVAQQLGYECVNREIILETVSQFNISETELLKSLEEAPGFINKLTHGREKYLSYFRAALLEHVKKNNVVYHGHAGHLMLPSVRHLLKVRIIADMNLRIQRLQQKENLFADEAEKKLFKEDAKRYEWTKLLYNKDIRDSSLYDLVLHIGSFSFEDVCDLICTAASTKSFTPLAEDEQMLRDTAVSNHIHAALQNICDAVVTCHNGNVRIQVLPTKIRKSGFGNLNIQRKITEQMRTDLSAEILNIAREIPGVQHVVCDIGAPNIS